MPSWPTCLTFPREPDVIIGGADNPYLRRWHVIPRNRFFNIYLHHFMRSDDDRALHDHPWRNLSILLRGSYLEHLQDGSVRLCRAGDTVARGALAAHRVELLDDGSGKGKPVWTLFLTGRNRRVWGFLCPQGWVRWDIFTDPAANTTTGRGCE